MKSFFILLILFVLSVFAYSYIASDWQVAKSKDTNEAYQSFIAGINPDSITYYEYALYDSAAYILASRVFEQAKKTNTKQAYSKYRNLVQDYIYGEWGSSRIKAGVHYKSAFLSLFKEMDHEAADSTEAIEWRNNLNKLTLYQMQQKRYSFDSKIDPAFLKRLAQKEKELYKISTIEVSYARIRDSIDAYQNESFKWAMAMSASPSREIEKRRQPYEGLKYISKQYIFPKPGIDFVIITLKIRMPEDYYFEPMHQAKLEYAGEDYQHLCMYVDGDWIMDTRNITIKANTDTVIKLLYPVEHTYGSDLVLKIMGAKLLLKKIATSGPTDITKYLVTASEQVEKGL